MGHRKTKRTEIDNLWEQDIGHDRNCMCVLDYNNNNNNNNNQY